ncbi:hypothetical protein JX266_000865 [Neoarthrinium moseri]|nr:hypothetical protein JX266_000865 [Neoarthrinium moseri]
MTLKLRNNTSINPVKAAEPAAGPEIVYVQDWTFEQKAPPLLFTLGLEWAYAVAVLLIIIGNLEVQYQWAQERHIWHHLGYVTFRAALTTGMSIASTLIFEYALHDAEEVREVGVMNLQLRVLERIARSWDLDTTVPHENVPQQELDEEFILEWKKTRLVLPNGSWQVPVALFEMFAAISDTFSCVLLVLIYELLRWCLREGFLYAIRFFQVWGYEEIISFVQGGKMWVDYRPDPIDPWLPHKKFLGQIALQLSATVLLLLFMFLYRYRVQEACEVHKDSDLADEIRPRALALRSTAFHLLSYTAYQLTRFIMATLDMSDMQQAIPWWDLIRSYRANGVDLHSQGTMLMECLKCSMLVGFLTLSTHLVLRRSLRFIIRWVAWPLFNPIYEWRTIWHEDTVKRGKEIYLEQFDLDLALDNRVGIRAMATLAFPDTGPLPMEARGGRDGPHEW